MAIYQPKREARLLQMLNNEVSTQTGWNNNLEGSQGLKNWRSKLAVLHMVNITGREDQVLILAGGSVRYVPSD